MSFFKRLFGGGDDAGSGPAKAAQTIEHKGFSIAATPYKADGGQYQTCGVISKDIDGTLREHRFIRADRFGSLSDAVEVSLSKGRQLIDQLGDKVFD